MKDRILENLRSQNTVVSGEELSKVLGISRVSVWKHIHQLQELGYEIVSTPNGYQLFSSPDVLFPWEYSDQGCHIHYFPEVPSTMDLARDLARKGCPDFTVVIAGRQTEGRGRLKRHWLSDDGGLYFTMVLRPPIPAALSFKVNFAASLTMVRVIRGTLGVDAMVKWPNDILVDGLKMSGMLSEIEAEADRVHYVNIGMGINVNNQPSGAEPGATSLKTILSREVSRKDLLARFLDDFGIRMQNIDADDIITEWKKYAVTMGRYVRIVTLREQSEGLAVDVDETGALVLELDDGTLKKIVYGDCFLI